MNPRAREEFLTQRVVPSRHDDIEEEGSQADACSPGPLSALNDGTCLEGSQDVFEAMADLLR